MLWLISIIIAIICSFCVLVIIEIGFRLPEWISGLAVIAAYYAAIVIIVALSYAAITIFIAEIGW